MKPGVSSRIAVIAPSQSRFRSDTADMIRGLVLLKGGSATRTAEAAPRAGSYGIDVYHDNVDAP